MAKLIEDRDHKPRTGGALGCAALVLAVMLSGCTLLFPAIGAVAAASHNAFEGAPQSARRTPDHVPAWTAYEHARGAAWRADCDAVAQYAAMVRIDDSAVYSRLVHDPELSTCIDDLGQPRVSVQDQPVAIRTEHWSVGKTAGVGFLIGLAVDVTLMVVIVVNNQSRCGQAICVPD